MNYIVFDLEFSQPSSREQFVLEPFPFCFEIVQIGAVKMDENYKIKEGIDIQVKPFYYKDIKNSARKRIGIYSRRFQQLMTFPEAYEKFLDFCGKEYCLFTWGTTDIDIFYKNALIHRLQSIDNVKCFDVQKLFFEYVDDGKKQIGLQDAIKKLHLEQYIAHNAYNDAYSTAEILSVLKINLEQVRAINNTVKVNDIVYINEEYSSKDDALQKAKESKITCSCGAQAAVDRMIVLGKRKAIAAAQCTCGKEYFIVAQFLKNKSNGKINLQCQKWIMSEELKAFYLKQKGIDDAIAEYAKKHSRKVKE